MATAASIHEAGSDIRTGTVVVLRIESQLKQTRRLLDALGDLKPIICASSVQAAERITGLHYPTDARRNRWQNCFRLRVGQEPPETTEYLIKLIDAGMVAVLGVKDGSLSRFRKEQS